jgi:peptidoglycan/xylan/chitin deacetylase (PgdA/CDA1 family)
MQVDLLNLSRLKRRYPMRLMLPVVLMFFSALLAAPSMAQERQESTPQVVLFASASGQTLFKELELDYEAGLASWRELLTRASLEYLEVDEEQLNQALLGASLLIVHSSERMSDEVLNRIIGFTRGGGNLLLTGLPAKETATGEQRQQSLPELLLGLQHPKLVSPQGQDLIAFAIREGTPLAYLVMPGFRFELKKNDRMWTGYRNIQDGHYVGWTLRPLFGQPASMLDSSSIVLEEIGGSRIAWTGFLSNSMADWDEQGDQKRVVLSALLRWLTRVPEVTKSYWPAGYDASAVITADVEDKFENGEDMALLLHREKVPGSFFLLGKLAAKYHTVVYALARTGEVGSHSVNHDSFQGRSYDSQLEEIRESVQILAQAGAEPVIGFRPPMELYDQNTIKAVAALDLGFIYGNLDYNRSWPIKLEIKGKVLYQFARIVDDDFNIAYQRKGITISEYRRLFIKEAHRVLNLGGIFPMSYHTNYLATPEHLEVLGGVIRWLKTQDVWITTFGNIVEWLKRRDSIILTQKVGIGSLEVTLHNTGEVLVDDFTLTYLPPRADQIPSLLPPGQDVKIEKDWDDYGYLISMKLAPGEVKRLVIK